MPKVPPVWSSTPAFEGERLGVSRATFPTCQSFAAGHHPGRAHTNLYRRAATADALRDGALVRRFPLHACIALQFAFVSCVRRS